MHAAVAKCRRSDAAAQKAGILPAGAAAGSMGLQQQAGSRAVRAAATSSGSSGNSGKSPKVRRDRVLLAVAHYCTVQTATML